MLILSEVSNSVSTMWFYSLEMSSQIIFLKIYCQFGVTGEKEMTLVSPVPWVRKRNESVRIRIQVTVPLYLYCDAGQYTANQPNPTIFFNFLL